MPALRPLRVDVVGERLHVGEVLVGQDVLPLARAADLGIAGVRRDHPAVVDVDVLVAVIGHARWRPSRRPPRASSLSVIAGRRRCTNRSSPSAASGELITHDDLLNSRVALPRAFLADTTTEYVPFFATEPDMRPVVASRLNPAGRLAAANLIGRSPVAAMVKRTGCPGRTPKTLAPLMRGFGDGFGVQDHRLFPRPIDRDGLCAQTDQTSVRPVRVVKVDAVVCTDDGQQQELDPGQRHIHCPRSVASLHQPALIERFAIAYYLENNAAVARAGAIINPYPSHESPCFAVELIQKCCPHGSDALVNFRPPIDICRP